MSLSDVNVYGKLVTSQKVWVYFYSWGAIRVSFLKGAIPLEAGLAQRPRDSKILPQHRRKG